MNGLHGGGMRFLATRGVTARKQRAVLLREPGTAPEHAIRFLSPIDGTDGPLEIDPNDTFAFQRILSGSSHQTMNQGAEKIRIDAYQPIWGDYPDVPTLILAQGELAELETIGQSITEFATFAETPPATTNIPAAYTYIGQFIAHDLSDMQVGNTGTINLRTTSLDLSSLFGSVAGLGGVFAGPTVPSNALRDLPRLPGGVPNIPDKRNDANLAVAQVHNMVARFFIRERAQPGQNGQTAHRNTVNYFQWAVLHDYLEKIVGQPMIDTVFAGPRLVEKSSEFLLPMEFALACFRFGHSQIRHNYYGGFGPQPASSKTLIEFTNAGGVISGADDKLTDDWQMIWPTMIGPNATVFARQISARIAHTHGEITTSIVSDPQAPTANKINLASETLIRGKRLSLPTAQVLTDWIQTNRADIGSLGTVDMNDPVKFAKATRYVTPQLLQSLENGLIEETPLWLYTLLESQAAEDGERLGPLASRIVAETLIAAIEADPNGILSPANQFQPEDINGQLFVGNFGFDSFVERAFSP